jgi:hypothetical protein
MPVNNIYEVDYYNSLVEDGKNIKPLSCYTERELIQAFEKILIGLKKDEDWQDRITALENLQALARGDGCHFELFIQLLRSCHELVT